MYSKLLIAAIVLITVAIGYQCSTVLRMPTVTEAQKTGISLDYLVKGRELYISNCGSCHNLYLPERYTATQWLINIGKMKKPAKINDEQSEIILKYILSKCRN